jgi:DNA-binding beta-propeller fold protein YncE
MTRLLCFLAPFLMLHSIIATAQSSAPLSLTQTVALPDVRGRIDHLGIDIEGARLFVAALGNDTAEVLDLRTAQRIQSLTHLQEPQGVAFAGKPGQLFVSNGRSGAVDVFSGNPLVGVGRIDGLGDADNVRYDAADKKVYVGYEKALAVIDASSGKIANRIKLNAHPESFQLETNGPRIFVNVPNAQQIAVVDRKTGAQIATWSLGDARANFPMALNERDHRLFVATRRPAQLLVYDTESGMQVAKLPTGGDADDLFYDAQRKRLYVVCGVGLVDVVQQTDGDHYQSVANIKTSPGARTGLFAASRSALYVAVPARGTSPAEIRIYAVP